MSSDTPIPPSSPRQPSPLLIHGNEGITSSAGMSYLPWSPLRSGFNSAPTSPVTRKKAPPPPAPRRGAQRLPAPPVSITSSASSIAGHSSIQSTPQSPRTPFIVTAAAAEKVHSRYLMNDIPRGTTRVKLINSLLAPNHARHADIASPGQLQPDVQFGLDLAFSRLDFELAVARIEFSDTPKWLQALNDDPCGFPKKTVLGTLWRWVDTSAVDQAGQTEFIRAVIDSNDAIHYAEMLAEFEDTDVNIQDRQGRTALHWACARNLPMMVMLCLSVPTCDVGLRDNANLTAFDIAYQSGNTQIPTLFYEDMFATDEQTSLLRLLTMTAEQRDDKPVFPGDAMFDPVEDRNKPLVKALIDRGIDLTARDVRGDTALHVAAAQIDNIEIADMLLEAGSDGNAVGNGGATPLHHAVSTADREMVKLLLFWDVDCMVQDENGMLAIDLARENRRMDIMQLLLKCGNEGGVAKEERERDLVRMPRSVRPAEEEIVEEFPELGADVETIDRNKQTLALPATEDNNLTVISTFPAIGEYIHGTILMPNEVRRRVNREFRIMFRPRSGMAWGPEKKGVMRRGIARALGQSSNQVDELLNKLAEKAGHWALVVLAPSDPPELTDTRSQTTIRPPIEADDPRIERVFKISRIPRELGVDGGEGPGEQTRSTPRSPTLDDSDQEDAYEDDDGFPDFNKIGRNLRLEISLKPRPEFVELRSRHLAGPVWDILTGVESRTKLTNSELAHEARRIWKRQLDYTFLDNNCQQFCILLAIKIRARNHALLRILEGEIVRRQTERMM